VEGYEVLSPGTRDRFLERGDIEWVEGGEHEGRVSKEARGEGNVVLDGKIEEVEEGGSEKDTGKEKERMLGGF
jgi:hypothetical protein